MRQGLIIRQSPHGVDDTVRRLRAAIEAAGLIVFVDFDHGRNATDAGLALAPMRLILFGNPKGGTPLMQQAATAGIDLPFKALVWQDASGVTQVGYNDPAWLAERHGLGEAAAPTIALIAAGMAKIVSAAIA